MEINFRTLRADEIEIRVGSVWDGGASLLLYKDARCDMNLLDEVVGPMNWKREHSRDNANCTVSIWDESKHAWVSKEDTGTQSFTEAEKGLASDSFKRACVNWGIGRELYSAPFTAVACPTQPKNGGRGHELVKKSYFAGSFVKEISYDENRNINHLVICDKNGNAIFGYSDDRNAGHGNNQSNKNNNQNNQRTTNKSKEQLIAEVEKLASVKGKTITELCGMAGVVELFDMNESTLEACISWLKGLQDKEDKK